MSTACVVSINDAQFEQEVLRQTGPVLVDFYTPLCPPCRQVAPVLEQLCSEKHGTLKIVKIDAEENPVTATNHQIHSVPTLILYQDGKVVGQTTGARSKHWFEKWIENSINN